MAEAKNNERSLPKINNKRVQTEGSIKNRKYQRFSFQLQGPKRDNEYLKNYDSRFKDQRKMVEIYATNHLCKKQDITQSLQLVQKKARYKQKRHTEQVVKTKDNQKKVSQMKMQSFRELSGKNQIQKALRMVQSDNGDCNSYKDVSKFTFNNVILGEVEKYFLLKMKKKRYDYETMIKFIDLLEQNNNVFKKISPIVTQSLLKLGFITNYAAGEIIYRQGSPICNVGVILWGQAILKKSSSKFRFSCHPGYALGEQVLFQKLVYSEHRSKSVEKGHFCTFERCKAAGSCGVLWIGEREWGWICQQLAKQGLKDLTLRFQSLLHRIYLRKREQRLLLG